MDQANTLRQLLAHHGAPIAPRLAPRIAPILGGKNSPYVTIAARFLLAQQASMGEQAMLLDGMAEGLAANVGLRERHDVWKSLRGQAHLQTLGLDLGDMQCVFRAHLCMNKLMHNLHKVNILRQALLRSAWPEAHWYAALPCEAALLAAQLGQGKECLWVVEPSVKSVTEVFQGIRRVYGYAAAVRHAVVVAGIKTTQEAQHLYQALCTHISPWLGQDLAYVGLIPIPTCSRPLLDRSMQVLQMGQMQGEAALMHHALLD